MSKKSKKMVLFSLGALFFGILCYAMWSFAQRPAIGTLVVRETISPDTLSEKNKPTKQYEGKYLSFPYPGEYTEKSNTVPVSGPVKESVFLTAANWGAQKIAVIVEEREGNDFMASPSFLMRLNKPKLYEKSSFSQGEWQGFIFAKQEQVFEQTVFVHGKDKIVSVSLSSPINSDGLKEALQVLLDGLRWRE